MKRQEELLEEGDIVIVEPPIDVPVGAELPLDRRMEHDYEQRDGEEREEEGRGGGGEEGADAEGE